MLLRFRFIGLLADKQYVPRWMYYVLSVYYIIDGIGNMVLIPFGYQMCLAGEWAERIVARGTKMRKKRALGKAKG